MEEIKRIKISTNRSVRSLAWEGDTLFDYTDGRNGWKLDGTLIDRSVAWGPLFDKVICSSDGVYCVMLKTLGTKGVILKNGKFVREINRSYYEAEVYEYPATIFKLSDGRDALVHCPERYNVIEIEELETGKRLTVKKEKYQDFFHSRLQVNQSGTLLLSAGWVWHPMDTVSIFDIKMNAADEIDLQERKLPRNLIVDMEIHTAKFHDENQLLLAAMRDDGPKRPSQDFLAIYDLEKSEYLLENPIEGYLGEVMLLKDHVVGFYEHPRLIEIKTGKTIKAWDDINSGKQLGSIIYDGPHLPAPIAIDLKNHRFAVASSDHIDVIQLGTS